LGKSYGKENPKSLAFKINESVLCIHRFYNQRFKQPQSENIQAKFNKK
jgi:hypothetical protein